MKAGTTTIGIAIAIRRGICGWSNRLDRTGLGNLHYGERNGTGAEALYRVNRTMVSETRIAQRFPYTLRDFILSYLRMGEHAY